ncbi:developmental pluripotency-associated protein 2 [Elgaria multicarinata webbii]|uniref:developmental pluripotency-associated protein 2 n=1 Tax=Elgaria multicarinata webbii TaxID=159646 RepID=UPI002FCD5A73
MPRRGRKSTKSVSAQPPLIPPKGLSDQSADETSSVDYVALKRAELQQLCKKLGLRATGKNAELVERLKAYHGEPRQKTAGDCGAKKGANENEECQPNPKALPEIPCLDVTRDVKTEPSEKKTGMIRGWCVVHGMVLHRPPSNWVPLLLQRGLVWVQDGKDLVPFHLRPLNIPVPEGLSDNYICRDCVIRNREKPKRCLLCQQGPGKDNGTCLSQNASRSLSPVQNGVSQLSFLATDASKDKRRTTEIRKLYQPQEDQAYAQRVDGVLSQMARGEVGMDQALRPLQPLVFHSPAPFDKM